MNYEHIYNKTSEIVTAYRSELEHVWPTPSTLDCLKFAVTEAAEVIDAQLRMNSAYARNNDKDLDPLDEVADCLLMLVSACGDKYRRLGPMPETDPDTLCIYCAEAARAYRKNKPNWLMLAMDAITICIDLLGQNAPAMVEKRLERIKGKVAP